MQCCYAPHALRKPPTVYSVRLGHIAKARKETLMNISSITTIRPHANGEGYTIKSVYFFDGHEISAAEYMALQDAAMARAYDELAA